MCNKYENFYLPKLKDTRNFQKNIHDELERIKCDAELLPAMFRAEAVFRKECKKEKDEAYLRNLNLQDELRLAEELL